MIRYTTDERIQQFSKAINYYSGANLNTIKKLITILPCEEVSFIVMITILTCCTIELGPIQVPFIRVAHRLVVFF